MIPDWVSDGLVGLAGGFIFAFTKLRGDLCEGDDEPTPRQKRAAWAQFANFMVTAPIAAATATTAIMRKIGVGPNAWVTWPMVATFIGVSANFLWPLLLRGFSKGMAAKFKALGTGVEAAIGSFFGGDK